MDRRRDRTRAQASRQVNEAYDRFPRHRKPSRFAREKLDLRAKSKSKAMSRRSTQMRNTTIDNRSHFKASVPGGHRKRVNPAYSSQPCPRCGHVHAKSRSKDRFVCLFSGGRAIATGLGRTTCETGWMIPVSPFGCRRAGFGPSSQEVLAADRRDSRLETERRLFPAGLQAPGAHTRTSCQRAPQVGGDGALSAVAVMDHPGQPDCETAAEILTGRTACPVVPTGAASERGKPVAKRARS